MSQWLYYTSLCAVLYNYGRALFPVRLSIVKSRHKETGAAAAAAAAA